MNQLAEYRKQQRRKQFSNTPPSIASEQIFRILYANAEELHQDNEKSDNDSNGDGNSKLLQPYDASKDTSRYPLQNILTSPSVSPSDPYCSSKSSNVDIILQYTGGSLYTLSHFFIAGDVGCDGSLREGLVWLYDDSVEEQALRDPLQEYDNYTEAQFNKLKQEESASSSSTPDFFFRTNEYNYTYMKKLEPEWKNVKYIRIKMIRGESTNSSQKKRTIDVSFVGLLGYQAAGRAEDVPFRDIPMSELPLKDLLVPRVRPFRYYTREFTRPCLVLVSRDVPLLQNLSSQLEEKLLPPLEETVMQEPSDSTSIQRIFLVDASKQNWMQQTAFAVRVGNVKFENEAYIIVQDPQTKKEKQYRMQKDLTVSNLEHFVSAFRNKQLDPFFRRQQLDGPSYNTESNLLTLTYDTFQQEVFSGKDSSDNPPEMAIMFHASELAEVFPTGEWEQMALYLKGNKKLRVALYDLTKNDVPSSNFTLGAYFVNSNGKSFRFRQKDAQANNFFDYLRFIEDHSSEVGPEDGKEDITEHPMWKSNRFTIGDHKVTLIQPDLDRVNDDSSMRISNTFALKNQHRSEEEIQSVMVENSVKQSSESERNQLQKELSKSYVEMGTSCGRIILADEPLNGLMKKTVPQIAMSLLPIAEQLAMYALRTIRPVNLEQEGVLARFYSQQRPQAPQDFIVVFVSVPNADAMQDEGEEGLQSNQTLVAQIRNVNGMDSTQFHNYMMVMMKSMKIE